MVTVAVTHTFVADPPVDVEALHDVVGRLMDALLDIEDRATGVYDPSTGSDAGAREVHACVFVEAEDHPAALRRSLAVVPDAVEAVRGTLTFKPGIIELDTYGD